MPLRMWLVRNSEAEGVLEDAAIEVDEAAPVSLWRYMVGPAVLK